MKKTVYLFDEVTGRLLGVTEAHESPLEVGVFLEPKYSTNLKPPVVGEKEYVSFKGGKWEVGTATDPMPAVSSPPFPTYQQLRAAEYPPIQDYLDAIVKTDLVAQQAYITTCLVVKAKYPKI
jgi:hypothetical protein